MRVLLFGAAGQLGRELERRLAPDFDLVALDRGGANLANTCAIVEAIGRVRPAAIVNAAAYTAVDRAETEVASAHAINAVAPGVIGTEARRLGALVVHYSSDYVFDGTKPDWYDEADATAPLSVYGASKRDGERALEASGAHQVTLRTSWVVGADGANFARTMLKLARAREQLSVVADQHGVPTPAPLLARMTALLLERHQAGGAGAVPAGLYHLVPGGETTWHGYACHVLGEAARHGLALRAGPDAVAAITTADYPTPARRPANSRLATHRFASTFGVALPEWRQALGEVLPALFAQEGTVP